MTATLALQPKAWHHATEDTQTIMERMDVLRVMMFTARDCIDPDKLEWMQSLPNNQRWKAGVIYNMGMLEQAIFDVVYAPGKHYSPIINWNLEDWQEHMAFLGADHAERRAAFLAHAWFAAHLMIAGMKRGDGTMAVVRGVPLCRRVHPFQPWEVRSQAAQIGTAVSVRCYLEHGEPNEQERMWIYRQVELARDIADGRPLTVTVQHVGRDGVFLSEDVLIWLALTIIKIIPDAEIMLLWHAPMNDIPWGTENVSPELQKAHDDELLKAINCLRHGIKAAMNKLPDTKGGGA